MPNATVRLSIIAEGVPESQTRSLNKAAIEKGVGIIGPATVGGIKVRSLAASWDEILCRTF